MPLGVVIHTGTVWVVTEKSGCVLFGVPDNPEWIDATSS